eukprot:ctg_410.g215
MERRASCRSFEDGHGTGAPHGLRRRRGPAGAVACVGLGRRGRCALGPLGGGGCGGLRDGRGHRLAPKTAPSPTASKTLANRWRDVLPTRSLPQQASGPAWGGRWRWRCCLAVRCCEYGCAAVAAAKAAGSLGVPAAGGAHRGRVRRQHRGGQCVAASCAGELQPDHQEPDAADHRHGAVRMHAAAVDGRSVAVAGAGGGRRGVGLGHRTQLAHLGFLLGGYQLFLHRCQVCAVARAVARSVYVDATAAGLSGGPSGYGDVAAAGGVQRGPRRVHLVRARRERSAISADARPHHSGHRGDARSGVDPFGIAGRRSVGGADAAVQRTGGAAAEHHLVRSAAAHQQRHCDHRRQLEDVSADRVVHPAFPEPGHPVEPVRVRAGRAGVSVARLAAAQMAH